jgi:tRNA uridine 5-carbamoylmethylation protein Kti12
MVIDVLNYLASFLMRYHSRKKEANKAKLRIIDAARCDGCIWADQVRGVPWSEEVFKELRQA